MSVIAEQSISLPLVLPKGDVHAQMEIFYNPLMASNRSISILLLNTLSKKNLTIADPLAGSGIRSLRFLKELHSGKIQRLCVNDLKPGFTSYFKKQLKRNKITLEETELVLGNTDATPFLLHQNGFDYIDIDPFGSPNPFLAAAAARISREGIVAITATDTAALTGTYPRATRRKYWAEPLHTFLMHEVGLRILIRRIQLQGTQFDKAFVPLLSYHKDHYFRVYLRATKGKEKCDQIVEQHQYFLFCTSCLDRKCSRWNNETCACGKQFQFAGPLWTGPLGEHPFIQKMADNNPFPEEKEFLDLLAAEAAVNVVGFHDLHEIARRVKKDPPRLEKIIKRVRGVRTQFSGTGIKTTVSRKEIEKEFNER
ncbi:hypothetical protein HY496_00690 [Candidatus Woesearchaeota archaeon]|nr:hypothetical protein [Candidatus Woesearchaeota archaeon]